MAIIDLDKIIVSQTIIGVNCPRCGGKLSVTKESRFKRTVLNFFSAGLLSIRKYRCDNCGKEVIFLWKRTKAGS
ncbi:MAG: hypothetical protein JNL60_17060 [Bacteroidia bacterium]|nr:hypothetical protein [Bacteroidia bacterium]